MEKENNIPEKNQELAQRSFDQLLAEKLKLKSLSSLPRQLPDEKDDIPDVRRWR